jgi:NagD protein
MNKPAIDTQLAKVRHIALDMDGTIYKGGTLFDFTRPFLDSMRDLGIGVTFLTNNSSKSATDYLAHLKRLGLDVQVDQIFTAGMGTIAYLQANCSEMRRLFVLGTESLRREFTEAGFQVVEAAAGDEPDAVVVGFDLELVYARLCRAGYWIAQGKPFVATHPDLVCPTDQEDLLIDCGSICACLTSATGRSPDLILGKPHPVMLEAILRREKLEPDQLAMVGDRLATDIAMAEVADALGVLVLTGEASANDAKTAPTQPDLVVADLAELGRVLLQASNLRA